MVTLRWTARPECFPRQIGSLDRVGILSGVPDPHFDFPECLIHSHIVFASEKRRPDLVCDSRMKLITGEQVRVTVMGNLMSCFRLSAASRDGHPLTLLLTAWHQRPFTLKPDPSLHQCLAHFFRLVLRIIANGIDIVIPLLLLGDVTRPTRSGLARSRPQDDLRRAIHRRDSKPFPASPPGAALRPHGNPAPDTGNLAGRSRATQRAVPLWDNPCARTERRR